MTAVQAMGRDNVQRSGRGATTVLFANGMGCAQNMWNLVAPAGPI